jgi:hypothetical protein
MVKPAAADVVTWGVQRTDRPRGVTWIRGTLAEVAERLGTEGGIWKVVSWRA